MTLDTLRTNRENSGWSLAYKRESPFRAQKDGTQLVALKNARTEIQVQVTTHETLLMPPTTECPGFIPPFPIAGAGASCCRTPVRRGN